MNHTRTMLLALGTMVMIAIATMVAPTHSYAADPVSQETCTSFADRASATLGPLAGPSANGMLSDIYKFITTTIGAATQQLFQAFTSSTAYQTAVGGAMTLMILFYAAGFMIGVVQPSFQQALIRIVKIGVVGAIISPTGWTFFSENVVSFFQDGSDQLIKGVQAIGFGITAPPGATPFYALDRIATFFIQPDTIIAVMGSMGAGGPFGLAMGALMMLAMYGFFRLILKTLEIYAVTFVARSLVLGVAPIFFVFLLFDKTKNMFIAWVNALLNLSLQPILMFTFLSFFLVLIETSAKDMLGAELCWHEFKNSESGGNKLSFWRFKDPTTGLVSSGDQEWSGSLECLVSPQGKANSCPSFPLNVVDILSFLILVFLASKFAEVTQQIANELSNAVVNLDNQGKLDALMQSGNKSAGAAITSSNTNPKTGGQGGTGKAGTPPPIVGKR